MQEIVPTVEDSSEYVLYAMDETLVRVESDNRRTWSPVGVSPVLESNGSHKGVNIIGATEITKNYDTLADVYPADHSITSKEIQQFLEELLERNPNKKVYVLLDNAGCHNSSAIQNFWNEHKEHLILINTPRYSPELNPQENIWNKLKTAIFQPSARASIYELFDDIAFIYDDLNVKKDLIKSMVNPRNYYFNIQKSP